MIKYIALAITLLIPSLSNAAPTITSASISGGNLVIGGSGFGTKSTAAPLKFERFEVKDGGGAPVVGNTVPTEISYWTGRGGTYSDGKSKDLVISDVQRTSSSSRSAASYLARASGVDTHAQMIWHDGVGWGATGKVYCNMWIKWAWVQSPTYLGGGNYYQIKSFNLDSGHDASGNVIRPYITEFVGFEWETYTQSYHRNGRVSLADQSLYYANDSIPLNNSGWVNVTIISEPGTNINDGSVTDGWRIIELSRPGTGTTFKINSETNKNYLDDVTKGTHPINAIKLGWYLGNNLATGNTTLYYDDIYMDNTFQRVELCDASTKAASTHCEIQPTTVWSDTAATATLNSGSFTAGSQVYALVYDASNAVASYGPLTIPVDGGGGGTSSRYRIRLDE